jgi:hypothetical protein
VLLPAPTWSVDFYHATNSGTAAHVHPFIPTTTGSRSGLHHSHDGRDLGRGTYSVGVVAGDPNYFGNRLVIAVEGSVIVSGTTTSAQLHALVAGLGSRSTKPGLSATA